MSRSIDYRKQLEGAHVSTAAALGRRLYGCSKKFDDIRWNRLRAEERRTFAIFQLVRRSSGIHVRVKTRIEFSRVATVLGSMITPGRVLEAIAEFGSTELAVGLRRETRSNASASQTFRPSDIGSHGGGSLSGHQPKGDA
jgi:hypothetical protein